MNEVERYSTMFLWMQMVQQHNQDRLIYVVNRLYSTCSTSKMIELDKEQNLYYVYIFVPSVLKSTNKNLPATSYDSFFLRTNHKKRDSYLSLVREQYILSHFFFDFYLMTLLSLIPIYYLLLIPSTIIIALTLYGLSWIGFQLFIHN